MQLHDTLGCTVAESHTPRLKLKYQKLTAKTSGDFSKRGPNLRGEISGADAEAFSPRTRLRDHKSPPDAAGEEHHLISQNQCLHDIVGDDDRSAAGGGHEGLKVVLKLLPPLGVEGGKRLIEEENLRPNGEGADQRNSLRHSPGELARTLALVTGEANDVEQRKDARVPLSSGDSGRLQREADVATHRQPREQPGVLEDHAQASPSRPIDWRAHPSSVGCSESCEGAKERRLAAARRTDHRQDRASLDRQRHIREDLSSAEHDAQPLRSHQRHGTTAFSSRDAAPLIANPRMPMQAIPTITPSVSRMSRCIWMR